MQKEKNGAFRKRQKKDNRKLIRKLKNKVSEIRPDILVITINVNGQNLPATKKVEIKCTAHKENTEIKLRRKIKNKEVIKYILGKCKSESRASNINIKYNEILSKQYYARNNI